MTELIEMLDKLTVEQLDDFIRFLRYLKENGESSSLPAAFRPESNRKVQ